MDRSPLTAPRVALARSHPPPSALGLEGRILRSIAAPTTTSSCRSGRPRSSLARVRVGGEDVVPRILGANNRPPSPTAANHRVVRVSSGSTGAENRSPPRSSSNMTAYGTLDGSRSPSTGSWKLVPSSLTPRKNHRSSANSAAVSTFLAASMNVSAGGTGFIEMKPATFSGCVLRKYHEHDVGAHRLSHEQVRRAGVRRSRERVEVGDEPAHRPRRLGRRSACPDPGPVERAHERPAGELVLDAQELPLAAAHSAVEQDRGRALLLRASE